VQEQHLRPPGLLREESGLFNPHSDLKQMRTLRNNNCLRSSEKSREREIHRLSAKPIKTDPAVGVHSRVSGLLTALHVRSQVQSMPKRSMPHIKRRRRAEQGCVQLR
jgi:hypothetical protein